MQMSWVMALLRDAPRAQLPSSVVCFPWAPRFPTTTATAWGAAIQPAPVPGRLTIRPVPPLVTPPLLPVLRIARLMALAMEVSAPQTFSTACLPLDSRGQSSVSAAVAEDQPIHPVYNTLTPRIVLIV